MLKTITVRHCVIPDELKTRAEEVLDHLGGHASRPVDGAAVFDVGPNSHAVELRLHLSNGEVLFATGEATDHRSALDRAEQKLRRQLEKGGVRPRRRRTRSSSG